MKKDTLYTVNKWNQGLLGNKGNLFVIGGYSPTGNSYYNFYNPTDYAASISSGLVPEKLTPITMDKIPEGFATKGLTGINSFYNKNAGAINAAANAASPVLGNIIGGGYSTGGVGEGIATAGQAIGSALAATGVGAWAAPIVTLGSSVLGGLTNRAFGTKKNQKNINTLEENAANARNAGNELASASDSNSFFNAADSMVSGTGFKNSDLVKGGWFSGGKARREAQKYLNKENRALAMQRSGMVTGAQNVDSALDDNVMYNFAELGGPLDYMENNNNMGAIKYNFMSDFLNNKKKQAENKNNMTNMFAGMPTMFADGGKIEIKHPGRLTELKKRTGKTEAELYNDGNPDHKKMVVFARNSRRWNKKALGGYLKGKVYDVPKEEVDKLIAAGYGVEYL